MSLEKLKAMLAGNKKPAGATTNTAETPVADAGAAALSAEQETVIDAALTEAKADAKAEGVKEGAKAANDRMSAIVGHEKLKGKTSAIGAAVALAVKSPDMSADDVATFAAEHASAGSAPKTIAERMNGSGADLALGGPVHSPAARAAAGSWDKALAKLPGNKPAA